MGPPGGFSMKLVFLLLAACLAARTLHAEESLFAADRAGNDSGPEGNHYELGTVFRATVAGAITHLRVYGLASESGQHTARIWRNTDNSVVAGPFSWSYGGTNGWITLDIPDVPIDAGVDHTVVVSTGDGARNYPFRAGDLAVAGGNGLNLRHPVGAGVFTTTAGARPEGVFDNANYYRDILFVARPPEPPTNAPVRINEFLAANSRGLRDEDGDSSDWIELHNPAGEPAFIGGWQLWDGERTWTIPTTNLPAQGFLVVFASGKNRTNGSLHTSFRLARAGGAIALRDGSGTAVSEWIYPAQREDVSYGRGQGGAPGFMPVPTPRRFNGPAFEGLIADTVFSVNRGFFDAPFEVTVASATTNAVVRFTVDGSEPTESSPVLSQALSIRGTTTLRARAFRAGWVPTDIDTQTYIFASDVIRQTATNTLAVGWPAGPVNGQVMRYGTDSPAAGLANDAAKTNALRQIPSLSLTTDLDRLVGPAAGVYVNPQVDGLEQPVSLELIDPAGGPGFQIDAGLRMRGGQSRAPRFPKHSFNLFFRSEYGAGQLEFPLFGADGANRFDTLSLRCEHGYAYADPYPIEYRLEFTALRDMVCRDLWASAGHQSTRSEPYHLYLNGRYWGLYQTQERAQEDFAATYFGGSPAEYDCVAATGLPQLTVEATAGTLDTWLALWRGTRSVVTNASAYFALVGRNPDGSSNTNLPVLVDPQELAAYMLLHYYTGHSDEPLSVSFGFERPNNFRAARRRRVTEPWHFFVHDGESSLRANEWVDDRANAVNLTSANRNDPAFANPEWMHEDLLSSPEYRMAFADEAHRLLRRAGPFTPVPAQEIWDRRAAQISEAVIGESMRWAQSAQENQSTWAAKVDEVRRLFFPGRTERVIGQLRRRGLFPSVEAPDISPLGGRIRPGDSATITNGAANGTIWFTTDGSDPRAIGGAPAGARYERPIVLAASTRLKARVRLDTGEWSAVQAAIFEAEIPASVTNLVVSKVHYHPTPPTSAERAAGFIDDNDFEYLEFQNTGSVAVDLRGVRVTAGVAFDFGTASIGSLAPGGRVVVVENPAAFALRFGTNARVAGVFAGNLGNGGETIRVIDGRGTNIALFTYDDVAPWPLLADGAGAALVLRSAGADPASSGSWRSSFADGGKPGAEDVFTLGDWRRRHFTAAVLTDPGQEALVWGDAADPDTDGVPNALEYALGDTSPLDPLSRPRAQVRETVRPDGPEIEVGWTVRLGTAGVLVQPQASADLRAWEPVSPSNREAAGERFERISVGLPLSGVGSPAQRFVRVTGLEQP
jgi:hypothetical protein